ncbi:hypothetical protein LEP1GSC193_1541 [Leptospira alstonii serovar Pingchang str. 80-412]|uniref:Uncharacterized protein n=1 Tax=Leptospira alstonii serovar Pingchang str. 80-412 TaxID=1218564 RepID=T0FV83_9LEPT|nr:hypothetical protein LEP1GSC193_1541 [Leptospira alstonii serovar Pingchang str. 80-412]
MPIEIRFYLSIQSKKTKPKTGFVFSVFILFEFEKIPPSIISLQKVELIFRSILFFGTQYRRQM